MNQSNDTALFRAADLLVAGALLTRLPLPQAPDAAFARQAAATWAYPLIGSLVAVLAGCIWIVTAWLGLADAVQAGLVLLALVMMTGALHEDGLADSADGLWGGYEPARRLEIMKDSRTGAYGVTALILVLGLRWQALIGADVFVLVAAASLSRGVLPLMMSFLPQARKTGLAQSVGGPPIRTAWLAFGLGSGVVLLCVGFFATLIAAATAGVVAGACGWLARKRIGGITGDILGATQVLCELAILIALGTWLTT